MNESDPLAYWEVAWRGYARLEDRGVPIFCERNPYMLNSHGIWEKLTYTKVGMSFWEYPLPNLEIIIFSSFVLWRLLDILCNKIHLRVPRFTYMLIGGVILGQICYLKEGSVLRGMFFPDDKRPKVAETLGAFGFVLYWFLKGVTMDVGVGLRSGKKAAVIGFTSVMVPLVIGNIFFRRKLRRGDSSLLRMEYRLIVFMQSISAFTSIDTLLKDLQIKHSEFGRIALSGAMVSDAIAFVVTFLNAIHWEGYYGLMQTIFCLFFFAFLVFVMRPAMVWVVTQTPEGRPVKDAYIYIILGLAFLSFQFFEMIHLFGPTGAFVLGLTVPEGYPLGASLVKKFESLNLGALMPLFGSLTIMQVDFAWLFKECGNIIHMEGPLFEVLSFILLVNATKYIASTIAAFAFKIPLRDSIALSLVLNNKGIFELAYFTFAVERKLIRPEIFTILATFILLNSIFIPMALELVHDPTKRFKCYRKRNLLILKDGAELPCLVCVHKPDHITSMTNVLETFSPSRDSPMACNVLHLIELVGQASPMFISHQLQRPEAGSISCSDIVLNSFRHFHRKFAQYTTLNMFTSVSMSKHMHEDICWLALSRSLSLILLPFHRTLSVDRTTVISNDDALRTLNLNVLRRAPCSVGILVYRKPNQDYYTPGYQNKICLIYNGGKDDKEALAIANRMRLTKKRMSLTIIRFIPKITEFGSQDLESACKLTSLEKTVSTFIGSDIKENNQYVTFIDEEVSDGSETSKALRAMANDFDLFIVGKSSGIGTEATHGITEWTEFEELGTIGDLLASKEYPSRASVLVVKKQEYIHHTRSQKFKSK